MDYKEFFLTNNKSGYKTVDNKLKSSFPLIYNKLMNYVKEHNLYEYTFKEKIWYFMNGVKDHPHCEQCNKKIKFGRSLTEGYNRFCTITCANKHESHIENGKQTNLKNHGVTCSLQIPEIVENTRLFMLETYGVENLVQNTEYMKQCFINKYGVSHPVHVPEFKNKIKETMLERYGVENYLMMDGIKELSMASRLRTFMEKYKHLEIISIVKDEITIKCDDCGSIYPISRGNLYHRNNFKVKICTVCNPLFTGESFHEKEIFEYTQSLLPNIFVKGNDRDILGGKELDIYIPSYNLAIEYNGLYWHSTEKVDNDYHLNKTIKCEEQGIQLIHVFQDEWIYKQEMVKDLIKSTLGLNINTIDSELCVIKYVELDDSISFVEENNIQGSAYSDINIGLFYEEQLVSLINFKALDDDCYEMVRITNKIGLKIINGFDKILKSFIDVFKVKNIVSLLDRRLFNDKVYKTLGFEFVEYLEPVYWYFEDYYRFYRFYDNSFLKDYLLIENDSNKTEFEIMDENEIFRIYDCGYGKFVFNNTSYLPSKHPTS
jgi:hypothetical protein